MALYRVPLCAIVSSRADCVRVTDDISVVNVYPSIQCKGPDADSHRALEPLFYFLMVVVIGGAPFAMLVFLVVKHRKGELQTPKSLTMYGLCYQVYKQECFYCKSIELLFALSRSRRVVHRG